jgi:hypothetical protein
MEANFFKAASIISSSSKAYAAVRDRRPSIEIASYFRHVD